MSSGDYDGTEDYNERCECDEREALRARRLAVASYNRRTQKLIPNGNASRDRLVSARINLRREER
jgi:hypothetical protein